VLNLVAQPDKEFYIGALWRIVRSVVLLNARRQFPSLPVSVYLYKVPSISILPVERLKSPLKKD
jgi:hypothetical protein